MRVFLTGLLIGLCLSLPAAAQDAGDLDALTQAEAEARNQEARLKAERKRVTQEIATLKAQLAKDTVQTQAYERQSLRLANQLEETNGRIDALEADLKNNRDETQELLASLQRLEMAPSIATLSTPDDAVKTAQAATMIEILSSKLEERAETIRKLASDLQAVRAEALNQQIDIDANNAELLRRRERTQSLVDQKETLRQSIQTDEQRARTEAMRLAAEAETLRELLSRVVAIPDDVRPRLKPDQPAVPEPLSLPPGTTRFADAKGGLIRPVSGRLSKGFGQGEQGQTYSAPTGGQVLAPYAGQVEFVGPFRNYGRVVILNMDDGYYLLLTGLGRTYVNAGESVRRGEPVGQMPRTQERPPLYLELRRNGRTIDPSPWMGGQS